MVLIVPKTKPLSFGIKERAYTLFRTLSSFYFLKLTLSEKGQQFSSKQSTIFLKQSTDFPKELTVSTKMVKCFDKKGDVSILTHPLHNPLL